MLTFRDSELHKLMIQSYELSLQKNENLTRYWHDLKGRHILKKLLDTNPTLPTNYSNYLDMRVMILELDKESMDNEILFLSYTELYNSAIALFALD